ncbi:MAG: chemotaxis protein CheW [Gaiellales bacterium]
MSTDGQIVLDARRRAGLSQRRLADLAGTSQAMVARVESGRQSPSLGTLRRLLAACGANLQVQVDGEIVDNPAAIKPPQAAVGGGPLLLVDVGAQRFGIPLAAVREVLASVEPRSLPGQPPAMAGMVVVRGDAFPCIDLAVALGMPAAGGARGVVLDARDGPLVALVDGADDVRDLAAEGAVDIPAGWTSCDAVHQLARFGDELLPIVDAALLGIGGPSHEHRRATHSR